MSGECRRRTCVVLSVLDNLANRLHVYKSETKGDLGLFPVEFHREGAAIGEMIFNKTFLTFVQVGCKPITCGTPKTVSI